MDKTKFQISKEFGRFQYWHDCDDSNRYRSVMSQIKHEPDDTRTFKCAGCGTVGEVTIKTLQPGYGRFVVKDGD